MIGRVLRKMGLPLWTFVGIGVSAILFNALGSLIETILSDLLVKRTLSWSAYWPKLLVAVIVGAFVLAVITLERFRHSWRGRRSTLPGLGRPDGKKGLILLVSNLEHALFAVRYHLVSSGGLEHVWLIPSNDKAAASFGPGTSALALTLGQKIEELARSTGRQLTVEVMTAGVSPADAQDTYDMVNRIHRRSDLEPSELISDFTGGTKPMAVGMIMACLKRGRELEYVALDPVTRSSQGPYLIDYQHNAFDLIG